MFNNFDVAFQPIYDTGSDDVFGFEVLLRSNVPPSELFGRAKTAKDFHSLDKTARNLALHRFNIKNSTLFLNCHPLTVLYDDTLFGDVYKLLCNNNVVLEITEQEIPDYQLLKSRVSYLKELGALIALDDFGTGHSNFLTLRYIRPDFIKIDRSYIKSLSTDPRARLVTDFIIRYANEISCQVVAEGIEEFTQLQYIAYNQVKYAQGYLLGIPLLSADFQKVYY